MLHEPSAKKGCITFRQLVFLDITEAACLLLIKEEGWQHICSPTCTVVHDFVTLVTVKS